MPFLERLKSSRNFSKSISLFGTLSCLALTFGAGPRARLSQAGAVPGRGLSDNEEAVAAADRRGISALPGAKRRPVRRTRNCGSGAQYRQFLILRYYEPMPYDRESVLTISAVQEALAVSRADLLVAGKRYGRGFPTSGPDADNWVFYFGFHCSDACYGSKRGTFYRAS